MAQRRKYEYMFKQLNLHSGSRLLDVGCGYGDWMAYCASKGVDVLGINLSPEQGAAVTERHGLKVIVSDWRDVWQRRGTDFKHLCGRFDAVTCLDTIEHYPSPYWKLWRRRKQQTYAELFALLTWATRPHARFFTSCLFNGRRTWGWRQWVAGLMLDHTMCGLYPDLAPTNEIIAAAAAQWVPVETHDETENYRISSVLSDASWQNSKNLTLRAVWRHKWALVREVGTNPGALFSALQCVQPLGWMTFFGKDADSRSYDPVSRAGQTYVVALLLTFKRKQSGF